ncbi:MAG: insulinase family protein [Oscillospiraceae bacterium]|nr:insulinase family protein [Oscillospiraceae bacterium]
MSNLQLNTIKNDNIDEKYYSFTHKSGLKVLLYPMPKSSTTYALFGTNYGSVDVCFKTDDMDDFVTVPDGIAHFLEHKLFESEQGDAFTLFAQTGANANAFTSFDKTCYLFSCADNFNQSLEILLSFVTDPYFTKETVQKEQGIIGQEIRMYEDDPNWRVFFNTLEALYVNNPVRRDIAGTVESISQIDDKLLYSCYNTFYNLNNMVLSIAGKFEVDDVINIMDKTLKPSKPIGITTKVPDEPEHVCKANVTQNLEVATPLFSIGFKEQTPDSSELVKASVETDILLELIAGKTSPLNRRLYDEGIINQSFGSEIVAGRGFFCTMFDGESRNPHKVQQKILKEIENLKANGINEADFSRVKKAHYGQEIRDFTNPSKIANSLINSYFSGCDIYDFIDATSKVTLQDVTKRLEKTFVSDRCVLSVIQKN